MMCWRVLSAVTAAGAILLASSAGRAASPGDTQTAEALYQSAKEALGRGELASACVRFGESQRLDPAVGTLLNLADCEERSGRLATALGYFQEAHDELGPGDYRRAFSEDRIARLAPRVPRLTLRVRGGLTAAMAVLRDETALGPGSMGLPLPVDPGAHVCVVRAAGHTDSRTVVTLREGEAQTIDLAPGPIAAPAAMGPGRASGGTQRAIGFVVAGVGVAALGVGTAFGFIAKKTYDDAAAHCPSGPTTCDSQGPSGSRSAYDQATVSTAAFIAGGALVAGGVVLLVTAPRAQLTITPLAGPREAGLGLRGAW